METSDAPEICPQCGQPNEARQIIRSCMRCGATLQSLPATMASTPREPIGVRSKVDSALLVLLAAPAAFAMLQFLPDITILGSNIANQKGPAQFGGVMLAFFCPVLPFVLVAAIMYGVASVRKTKSLDLLNGVALVLAIALVFPLASTVMPDLAERQGWIGLQRYPIGFALFFGAIGIGVIVGTYKQLQWSRRG